MSQERSEERRRHSRHPVEGLSGTLTGRERHSFAVITLSRGGLLVTMDVEPALGQVFDLELPLGRDVFRSPGRVVFIGEDKSAARERRYRVGIGIEQESAEDGGLLDRYIRERLEARPLRTNRNRHTEHT